MIFCGLCGESQPKSDSFRLSRNERLKNSTAEFFRNTGATVQHVHSDHELSRQRTGWYGRWQNGNLHDHVTARSRSLDRILHKVQQGRLHLLGIGDLQSFAILH